jgi:hypothetical protein
MEKFTQDANYNDLVKAAKELGFDRGEYFQVKKPELIEKINAKIDSMVSEGEVQETQEVPVAETEVIEEAQESQEVKEVQETPVAESSEEETEEASNEEEEVTPTSEKQEETVVSEQQDESEEEKTEEPKAKKRTDGPVFKFAAGVVLDTNELPLQERGQKWHQVEGAFPFKEGDIIQVLPTAQILKLRKAQVLHPSAKRWALKGRLINPVTGELQGTHVTFDFDKIILIERDGKPVSQKEEVQEEPQPQEVV